MVSLWDSDVFARNIACLCGLVEDVLSGVVLARTSKDRCDVTAVDTTLLGLWTEGLLSGVQGATQWSFYPAPLPRAMLRFAVSDLSTPAAVNAIRDVRIADVQGGNLAAAARPARAVLRVMLGAVSHADPAHLRVEVFPALAKIAQGGIFRPQHYSIAIECLSQLALRSHNEGDQERVALAGEATRVLMEHDPREPISKSVIEPFGEFERLRRSSSTGELDVRLAETDWADISEHVTDVSRNAAGASSHTLPRMRKGSGFGGAECDERERTRRKWRRPGGTSQLAPGHSDAPAQVAQRALRVPCFGDFVFGACARRPVSPLPSSICRARTTGRLRSSQICQSLADRR